jgi:CRP/FNR family transcriptional regulator
MMTIVHPLTESFSSAAEGALLLEALAAPHRDELGAKFPTPLRQRVAAGAALLHEGAPLTQIAVVQAGSFKCVKTADDGYEHVLSFAMRGDVLGYDGVSRHVYPSAAIALEDSFVLSLAPRELDALRRSDARLDAALQAAISAQLARSVELAELMSAVAADARMARFLMHWSARMADHGLSPRRLRLRMNRRDIASHLGVAHETVSRSLGQLADEGCLRVANREIEILDPALLRAHAYRTRGSADEAVQHGTPAAGLRLVTPHEPAHEAKSRAA